MLCDCIGQDEGSAELGRTVAGQRSGNDLGELSHQLGKSPMALCGLLREALSARLEHRRSLEQTVGSAATRPFWIL